jgi:glycosyltransferase involved in cell wall biosynthesis
MQKRFPEYVVYGGVVPFNKSVEVLKDYFAVLFPTYYEGEGFAGTIIDAHSAGVPIIASGGGKPETILATIEAGANAITYTPPTAQELFKRMMSKYREY